ncbi:MAG: hypothetical protein D6743_17875 [Calditrichaeota bacterium]|nr:MAG: hypothetical protein D6743_17875 [Calditrichota bacterium]
MNAKLAQLLRVSLEGDERRFNTLKQELAFVHDYLAIEKVRFGDKLRVHEEIDPSTLETRVPSMILQPIIENAIKHGISKMAGGGELTLRIYRADDLVNLEITNTGKNGPVTKGVTQLFQKGIGLRNTHERLKRIYGDSFGLRITAEPELFSVKITIPQNHANPE